MDVGGLLDEFKIVVVSVERGIRAVLVRRYFFGQGGTCGVG